MNRSYKVDMENLNKRILTELSDMTPRLSECARYLIDHPDAIVMVSMRDIAARIGVAPATLVRLARRLGFGDWSELRNVYVENFQSSPVYYADRADAVVKKRGVPGLVQDIMQAQRANFEHAANANSADAVDAAASILEKAPRIFIAAFMSCRAPGLTFSYVCRLFRENVHLLGGDGGNLLADLAGLKDDDVVLAINFHPYSRDSHLVARAVHASKAKLVSIADSMVTPVSPVASSILLFSAETPSFFPSLTAATSLVETLAAAMMAHSGESAVSRIGAVEAELYASGFYNPPTEK